MFLMPLVKLFSSMLQISYSVEEAPGLHLLILAYGWKSVGFGTQFWPSYVSIHS